MLLLDFCCNVLSSAAFPRSNNHSNKNCSWDHPWRFCLCLSPRSCLVKRVQPPCPELIFFPSISCWDPRPVQPGLRVRRHCLTPGRCCFLFLLSRLQPLFGATGGGLGRGGGFSFGGGGVVGTDTPFLTKSNPYTRNSSLYWALKKNKYTYICFKGFDLILIK